MLHDLFILGALILKPYFHLKGREMHINVSVVKNQQRYKGNNSVEGLFMGIFPPIELDTLFRIGPEVKHLGAIKGKTPHNSHLFCVVFANPGPTAGALLATQPRG